MPYDDLPVENYENKGCLIAVVVVGGVTLGVGAVLICGVMFIWNLFKMVRG